MGPRRKQQMRILETLEQHGWRRVSVDKSCDWWADEIWALSSVWPPVGARAWMVFLVDPEWKGHRSAGEGVCAVAVDTVARKERTGWLLEIPVGRRWERGLEELMEALKSARLPKADDPAPEVS